MTVNPLAKTEEATRIDAIRASIATLPTPDPVPDKATYLRQREKVLEANPDCRANYERYLAAQRGETVDYLPIRLDIENVSRCNFRCTMCVVSDWPKGKRADDMTLDDFRQIIDEQYGLVEIKIQGIGEPTMQGDVYFDMIRYARSKNLWVRTTTNASLLHLRDNFKKLIDGDPNEVQISIDGADRETFERIRRGSHFPTVAKNCRAINDYCAEQGIVRTKMWTVVQRENRHQLADIVRFAANHGFKTMAFALNLSDWGISKWTDTNNAQSVEAEFSVEEGRQLIALGAERGVTVAFWSNISKYSLARPETLCPWPFERAYVSSDMRLVPCCYIGNPDTLQIGGSLRESGSLTKIWQGEEYTKFRQAHLRGDLPEVCKNCYDPAGRS